MAPAGLTAVTLEVEFTAGAWTDLSSRLSGTDPIRITGGRADRYAEVAPGTLVAVLTNADGALTPGNPSSPWAPHVVRGKRIRLSVTVPSGDVYVLIVADISRWTITIPDGVPADATCTIQANDALARMERQTLRTTLVEQANAVARTAGLGCDAWELTATSINSDPRSTAPATTFANGGRRGAGGTLGTLTVVRTTIPSSPEAPGSMAASSAPSTSRDEDRTQTGGGVIDDLYLERLTLTPVPSATGGTTGPVLHLAPQPGMRRLDLWCRIPDDFFIPAGGPFDRVIADLWAGSTPIVQVAVGQDRGRIRLVVKTASGAAWGHDVDIADDTWRRLTLYRTSAGQIALQLADGLAYAYAVPVDIASTTLIVLGGARSVITPGKQDRCLPIDLAGIHVSQAATAAVPTSWCQGTPPAVQAPDRIPKPPAYADPEPHNF